MAKLVDRLPMLLELHREDHHIIRANADDSTKDKDGSCTDMLAQDLRFFAVADYYLKHDLDSFRRQLSEAAALRNELFCRYNEGEPIDDSFVSMLSYKSLFDSLAANNMEVAKNLSLNMGGRDTLEQKYDHPFDYAMGYTLRAFVLHYLDEMERWLPKLVIACEASNLKDFSGYTQVFQGILENNTNLVNDGFRLIISGHLNQTKANGVFADTDDEILCVWGIGMANLAVSYQIEVKAIPPLLPEDLIQAI